MGISPTTLSRTAHCVHGDLEQLSDSLYGSCCDVQADALSSVFLLDSTAGPIIPNLLRFDSKRLPREIPTHSVFTPAKLLYHPSHADRVEHAMRNTQRLVAAYLEDCRSRSLAPKTIDGYEWALKRLSDAFPKLPTNPQDLRSLINTDELSSESRFNLWRIFKRFYKWAKKTYRLRDVMARVERPRRQHKLPRTLERAEIDRLLEVSHDTPRDAAMIAVLLDTGIRLNELTNLRHPHVLETRLLIVEAKGGRQRHVPMSPQTRNQLRMLGDGYHIWTSIQAGHRLGRPMTRDGVQQVIKRVFRRAGIRPPKAGPHVLRHTFGRWYLKNGGDAFHLQRILGHRDIQTTMIYVTLNTDDLEEQHAAVSPYLSFLP